MEHCKIAPNLADNGDLHVQIETQADRLSAIGAYQADWGNDRIDLPPFRMEISQVQRRGFVHNPPDPGCMNSDAARASGRHP